MFQYQEIEYVELCDNVNDVFVILEIRCSIFQLGILLMNNLLHNECRSDPVFLHETFKKGMHFMMHLLTKYHILIVLGLYFGS